MCFAKMLHVFRQHFVAVGGLRASPAAFTTGLPYISLSCAPSGHTYPVTGSFRRAIQMLVRACSIGSCAVFLARPHNLSAAFFETVKKHLEDAGLLLRQRMTVDATPQSRRHRILPSLAANPVRQKRAVPLPVREEGRRMFGLE
jgi:hypothetical protein